MLPSCRQGGWQGARLTPRTAIRLQATGGARAWRCCARASARCSSGTGTQLRTPSSVAGPTAAAASGSGMASGGEQSGQCAWKCPPGVGFPSLPPASPVTHMAASAQGWAVAPPVSVPENTGRASRASKSSANSAVIHAARRRERTAMVMPCRPPSGRLCAASAGPRPQARSGLPCRRCPRPGQAPCRCQSWTQA